MTPIHPAAVAIIFVTGLAVVIYVLSVGPAIWLAGKGVIDDSLIETTYRPLTQGAQCCRPLDLFLQWYTSKWRRLAPYAPSFPVTIPQPVVSSPGIPNAPMPKSLRPATVPLTVLSDDSRRQ